MKIVTFVYGSGSGFSGQRFAIELIVQGLLERGWQAKIITTPLRDRVRSQNRLTQILEVVTLVLRLLATWYRGLWAVFRSEQMIVSLGQTKFALIRDGLPVLVKGFFSDDNPIVLTLNGNLIMNWSLVSFEAKILYRLVQAARCITVVGPNQKAQLIRLGVPDSKIEIVDNTCSLEPLSTQQVAKKQAPPHPLHVLYLSSLIEAKGYPEFVKALVQLSRETDKSIEVVLCGKITVMDADQRFQTIGQAKTWLEAQINVINRSPSVKIRWINGATGVAKESLFREAQIFVLPSRYKVEAQPIAIIEALASGCAVITSIVGEIPAMVSDETAILLAEVSADTITEAISTLAEDSKKRQCFASGGLQLFNKRFTYQTYIDRWEALLKNTVDSQQTINKDVFKSS